MRFNATIETLPIVLERIKNQIEKNSHLMINAMADNSSKFLYSFMKSQSPRATGEFERSIKSTINYGHSVTQLIVGPSVFYAPYVEFGVHTGRFRPPISPNSRFVSWVKLKKLYIIVGERVIEDPIRVAFVLRKHINRRQKVHRMGRGIYAVPPKFVVKKAVIRYLETLPTITKNSIRQFLRHAIS